MTSKSKSDVLLEWALGKDVVDQIMSRLNDWTPITTSEFMSRVASATKARYRGNSSDYIVDLINLTPFHIRGILIKDDKLEQRLQEIENLITELESPILKSEIERELLRESMGYGSVVSKYGDLMAMIIRIYYLHDAEKPFKKVIRHCRKVIEHHKDPYQWYGPPLLVQD